MKIAVVHNTYQWPGGEDVVVQQEREMLLSTGHQVVEYCRSNHEIAGSTVVKRIGLAQTTVWSNRTYREFRSLLQAEKPDLVHVHNTFAMISPSIYWAAGEENIPVVQTLHNFRLLCPQGIFLRQGRVCEECTEHSLIRSTMHGCYHDSHLATGAVALMLAAHRLAGTWARKIDCYIAVSEFARKKFEQGGLPTEKLAVKPHFIYPDPGERADAGEYAVFVGRFTHEKGLLTLLKAWKQSKTTVPLMIIGDGPLRSAIEAEAKTSQYSQVTLPGYVPRQETLQLIKGAKALLCASECYEQGPATILEAFACGVPVIAPSLGPIDEVVENERTGLLFEPGDTDDFAQKIAWAFSHEKDLERMGKNARQSYEAKYTSQRNYARLIEIYEHVLATRRRKGKQPSPPRESIQRQSDLAAD